MAKYDKVSWMRSWNGYESLNKTEEVWRKNYRCLITVMSDSLRPHELKHARLLCPSPYSWVSQTHVHWVSDTIQPTHRLSPPFPLALNLSQHQGLFQWVSSSHQGLCTIPSNSNHILSPANCHIPCLYPLLVSSIPIICSMLLRLLH